MSPPALVSPDASRSVVVGYRAASPVVITTKVGAEAFVPPKKCKLMVGPDGTAVAIGVTWEEAPRASHEDSKAYCRISWDKMYYDMAIAVLFVEHYVKPKTYDLPFHNIEEFRKMVEAQVYAGLISPEAGLRKFFNHMRSLVDMHTKIAVERKELHLFDEGDWQRACDKMKDFEQEVNIHGFDCLCGESNKKEAEEKISEEEIELIHMATSMGGNIVYKPVGYVGKNPEDVGDAEMSDDSDDDSKVSWHGCGKRIRAQACLEEATFAKMLKPYIVGLTLLPDSLKGKAFDVIDSAFEKIAYHGCSAEVAMQCLEGTLGKMHTVSDLRRMFLKATLAEDLDG